MDRQSSRHQNLDLGMYQELPRSKLEIEPVE